MEPLGKIMGEQLSSVVFVQDYLQLDFDGSRLTYNIWPCVERQGKASRFGDSGYRDELCALIGKRLVSVRDANETLDLEFEDGAAVRCALSSAPGLEGDRVVFFAAEGGSWSAW